ncbi:MAG: neutral zinc metallopeptidase [Ardenticatenaceae bacterium]
MFNMNRVMFVLLALLLYMPQWTTTVAAAPETQEASCLFFTETAGGQGGFSVCDDVNANFRTAFEQWGLQKVGYPVSLRYTRDGFVTQAFQKAIMQWRPESGTVALVNIFDDLHNAGFDDTLLQVRQTPNQLPPGWDGDLSFNEVVTKRQALLDERPALRDSYFAAGDPLTFYGLPTSLVTDMGNHYAIRLQRAVLQEWKEDVPWAKTGEVTIANGGDIAKELGALPAPALIPEAEIGATPESPESDDDQDQDGIPNSADECPTEAEVYNNFADHDGCPDSLEELLELASQDIDNFWRQLFAAGELPYRSPNKFIGYTESVETGCGPLKAGNAAYCTLDRGIYYDINLLQEQLLTFGDFAPVIIIAHEWGHFIQHQLRIQHRFSITQELQADCFAGAYAGYANDQGNLQPGDLEEAIATLYQAGDNASWLNPGAHGTPEQRVEHFEAGYQDATTCFQ